MVPGTSLSELWPVAVDWNLAFSRPQTRHACAYWQSLCRDRRMPARRDLDPRAMKDFIAYVNLVDAKRGNAGACEYVVSLQCDHATKVVGNVENRRLSEFLSPEVEARWRNAFDLPRVNLMPVRLLTRASTLQKHWLECEILLAPLGQAEEVDALFWVFIAWPVATGE